MTGRIKRLLLKQKLAKMSRAWRLLEDDFQDHVLKVGSHTVKQTAEMALLSAKLVQASGPYEKLLTTVPSDVLDPKERLAEIEAVRRVREFSIELLKGMRGTPIGNEVGIDGVLDEIEQTKHRQVD